MGDKKVWLAYSLYGFAVAIFFLYYLFPVEAVKNYANSEVSRTFPQLRTRIDQAQLVFPMGLRFENVAVFQQNNPFLEIERITIKPSWLSLIGGQKSITYAARTSGGRIEGDAAFKSEQITFNGNLDKVRLEEIPALQRSIPHGLSGILSGKISYRSDAANQQAANARINLSNCTIQLAEPFFNIDSLTFISINADAQLQNQQLKLTRCVFKGEELSGDLSGTGLLGSRLRNSTLNLSGNVQPNTVLFQRAGGDLVTSFLKGAGKGGLSININGPLNNPNVSFK